MLLDSEDFDHTASSEIVKDVWFGPREWQPPAIALLPIRACHQCDVCYERQL
jgi:hypothetical protein